MSLVRGCHVMAKGDVAEAMRIAPSIIKEGLIVNDAKLGRAAWAFSTDSVLERFRHAPMVVFDVEDCYVEETHANFFGRLMPILKLRGHLNLFDYVPIQVLGFLNLPPPFPVYEGPIGFWS